MVFVPTTRFELARPCEHHPLKVACLPISPRGPYQCKFNKVLNNHHSFKRNIIFCLNLEQPEYNFFLDEVNVAPLF